MLRDEIYGFLTAKGFRCTFCYSCGRDIIQTEMSDGRERLILPVEITATCPEEACRESDALKDVMEAVFRTKGQRPVIITADRWKSRRNMMEKRLLAHLEVFLPVFARNCEIRRIEKAEAAGFLQECHSYGDASCRYRYGLFLKRHTGRRISGLSSRKEDETGVEMIQPGTLVAVAEFSNARKWKKGDKMIRSYEWTRYASLPGIRINGGMGKVLRHFIKEVNPDDIMSYADLEWSEGSVYEQLGFEHEGHKEAVTFVIDRESGIRRALGKRSFAYAQDDRKEVQDDRKEVQDDRKEVQDYKYFQNLGSNKYRLKLTDYQ